MKASAAEKGEKPMYRTMLVFDSYELSDAVRKLRIWGESSEFEITDIVNDGITAYNKMKQNHYDLVITEIRITGMDGLQLLRAAGREGLCSHIVLCSEFPDFSYARQGIILGAFDYYTMPFEESLFFAMFSRIKNESLENEAEAIYHTDEITAFFENRDNAIYEYVSAIMDEIYSESADRLAADKKARKITKAVLDEILRRYEWLDLYIGEKYFYSFGGIDERNPETYKKKYASIICSLFEEYCTLCPHAANAKIQEVILYILNNPENNLRQKNIADELYMNSSYLSTVFAAQTGIHFVDYLTMVKLKRAAWLLKETNMKVMDIAERLDYRDIGYFSRLFKKQYKMTPTEYRLPDGYSYQI